MTEQHNELAVVILCGGRSSRMGLPKAALPFGDETMLARVLRLVGKSAARIVVAASPDQELGALPASVRIARDPTEGQGPLAGLLAGLRAIPEPWEMAFVASCDIPLLADGFIERMAGSIGDASAAVPYVDGRFHPLAAVYTPSVLAPIETLLAEGGRSFIQLFQRISVRAVSREELTDLDPQLQTLVNLNRPKDYLAALAAAGLKPSPDVLSMFDAQQ